jgi:hypothetical protein
MQIYVVPVEDGGDEYEILGAYSTPELAEEVRKYYNAKMEVQEFCLDYLPEHPKGKYLWWVHMLEDGNFGCDAYRVDPRDCQRDLHYSHPPNSKFLHVWAKDLEEAIQEAKLRWKKITESGEWK